MTRLPSKGYVSLRRYRSSEPGHRYFVTFNATTDCPTLASDRYFAILLEMITTMEARQDIDETTFVVMPDHIHMLFLLGQTLTLSRCVAKMKHLSRRSTTLASIEWQPGFYDHKVRKDEEEYPILHYMYMNPYRDSLLGHDEKWPYFHCRTQTWTWFRDTLSSQRCPYPEWLNQ